MPPRRRSPARCSKSRSTAPRASSTASSAARDITLAEITEAGEIISKVADPDAHIIFGWAIDPAMEGTVKITVVATGFDGKVDRPAARSEGFARLARTGGRHAGLPGARARGRGRGRRAGLPARAGKCSAIPAGGLPRKLGSVVHQGGRRLWPPPFRFRASEGSLRSVVSGYAEVASAPSRAKVGRRPATDRGVSRPGLRFTALARRRRSSGICAARSPAIKPNRCISHEMNGGTSGVMPQSDPP